MDNNGLITEIKELNVYTHGDSSKISTWSNVPYLFTETLIKKGIKINRIDINPRKLPEKLFNRYVWRVFRKITGKDDFYSYVRTGLNEADIKKRIAKAVKQYPNADAELFISFSHSALHCSTKPSILFGDWTIAYHYDHFLGKKPDSLVQRSVKRQDKEMASADLIISLFPGITRYLQQYYKHNNIRYIGNVVNRFSAYPDQSLAAAKAKNNNILFIGSRRYLDGLKQLLEAFTQLKKEGHQLKLHIIGMSQDDVPFPDDDIKAHGYLDKGNTAQQELYYNLLREARVIVNTTEKWGAFSSMIETMFYYTPVITTPYQEFVETFGQNIDFGYYSQPGASSLKANLEKVLQNDGYEQMSIQAHEAVKDFTWDQYIDNLLTEIRKLPRSRPVKP